MQNGCALRTNGWQAREISHGMLERVAAVLQNGLCACQQKRAQKCRLPARWKKSPARDEAASFQPKARKAAATTSTGDTQQLQKSLITKFSIFHMKPLFLCVKVGKGPLWKQNHLNIQWGYEKFGEEQSFGLGE